MLAAGLNWEWETFPQFMDELERRPRAINICAQAAHLPTRVYVMGDRALRREAATPDDIAEMRKITVEALRSGAFGSAASHRFAQDAGRRTGAVARRRRSRALPASARRSASPVPAPSASAEPQEAREPADRGAAQAAAGFRQLRRQILAETPSAAEIAKLAQFRQVVAKDFEKFFTMGNPPDYEPGPEKSVAAIARREGRSCEEVAYDYILGEAQYLYFPVVNYVTGDHAPILEMRPTTRPACSA